MGSGSMKTTDIKSMEALKADLHFVEPFESHAKIDLKMEGEDGKVKVTWSMAGEQGLIERFFFIFTGSMDKMIGPDYENGLKALKKVCEEGIKSNFERPKELATIDGFPIFQTTLPGRIYAMIRNKVRFDVMNDSGYMGKTVGQLMAKLAEHKLTMTGTIYAIGYLYDEKNQVMDVGVAVPVASIPTGKMEGFQVINIPARGAFGTDYYGEYKGTEKAHMALSRYMEQNKIRIPPTGSPAFITRSHDHSPLLFSCMLRCRIAEYQRPAG
jgi:effector-binding domain-containing protein